MKTRACTALFGVATIIAVMAWMPQRSHAQPGGGGDEGNGAPPGENLSDAATVDCASNGTDAHYEEFLE